ncbi:uncharacterized protein A4U43_C01F24240 [Asparagus officinalis]|uniref:Protein kinase domain-containing protein n=1 Tax=Asparagus officinalis TaxID=4686 RepID=A0A5P1FUA3_ASPOF|nr:probable receptor-like protein kinase At5g20050 [Asparagus officinalis]ONK81007.1 uncharacterized protein A4U43_C01F24240 [Asparagus officinalis]
MDIKTAKVLAAIATITTLLIILPILWRSLGLSKIFFLIAGISSAIILSILLWVLAQYIAIDHRILLNLRQSAEEIQLEYSFLRRVAGLPTKFRYRVLESATNNFRSLIGRGSSGSVFKGILEDGTVVAVKLIHGVEHGFSEFQSEISAIASVQHVNLVRLLGYCFLPDGGPRYLVYEFVANGSLDNWIFPKKLHNQCLSWPLRYRVAIDVAKALAYLHHDCRARVLHLDVKPENILLTEGFHAVVSDFGLSKLMKRDESRIVMTVRGTRGYLAPEWLLDRGVTEKSDVYSYGMVLFELVGGRRNVQMVQLGEGDERKWSYFPKIVAEKLIEGTLMEVVDKRVLGEIDEIQVRNLVKVALWCVQEEAGLRPSMARVVDMLEGRIEVGSPPETEMVIVDILSSDDMKPIAGGDGGDNGDAHASSSLLVFRSEEQQMFGSNCSLSMSVLSGR